jgi:hypothetical protein
MPPFIAHYKVFTQIAEGLAKNVEQKLTFMQINHHSELSLSTDPTNFHLFFPRYYFIADALLVLSVYR